VSLTSADLEALITAFDVSEWDEMTLVLDGVNVQLSKTGQPPAKAAPDAAPAATKSAGIGVAGAVASPAAVPSAPVADAPEPPSETTAEHASGVHRVTSPTVGVFWRAPDPSSPPFVEVGQRVAAEDPLCIVEVMKLFNHVQAGVGGVVRSVEVDNGAMVEHGQTLFLIDLDG
jgi:acetyl-CoA carboxylase biotin carboxyl carrier protein